jgi:16S rRNA processing protein RimM
LSKEQTAQDRLIGLGRISGAHGIRGALKVWATPEAATTDPAVFLALGEVMLGGQTYQVLQAERHKNQVLLKLSGIDTRDQADAFAGQEICGDRQRFPELPPGEFYWFQVLHLPVINVADGSLLGYLEEIIPTPAHDVYVVRQAGREVLLPAVEDVIVEVDLVEGVLKVAPPPGLLETYAD